ncbi:MAG: ribonuclease PH [Pelagibacteraceae bacterium]|nr:ribonuclease PH [Pelagibacteraceae bacterium]MBO6466085.1 ribonuclease PH [Pelagibacteraceae bacterium]MBO6467843.1 ribonuclease PH [Pelagibacteraceae bacterium]MBO6469859.1 ribonuclease PH [Pelagibacteraceae bacterium]MBO6478978.1 ribonuclease PH [Pelagibacteraceae bacterium]
MLRQNRTFQELRPISFKIGVNIHAEGSCLVKFGNTHVLCTASIDEKTPHWLKNSGKGWVTAEYGMLPRSTNTRVDREATKGKQSGRTQEIQRLIGRSLRSVINLENLGERQIKIDCDVIQADGGTRTASISGGFVALYQAVLLLQKEYNIQKPIVKEFVAAVSAGIIADQPNLDLDYNEDSLAQVDANFIICESGKIAEIQVTGEEYFFSDKQFQLIFNLAKKSVPEIIQKQKEVFLS